MMFQIADALNAEELKEINDALDGESYVDGRETAANAASLVKRNVQLSAGSEMRAKISNKIAAAMRRNQMFLWLAMPKEIGPFHLTRYEETHTYGDHVDNSIMGLQAGNPMRADISMTIFLNEPEDYDGGELIMNSRINPQAIKLPAGHAIVYPTGEFHRVEPVTRGVRSVAITWIQSIIRDVHQRQVLTDIWTAMDGVSKLTPEDKLDENQPYRSLSKTHWGLLRLWSES
jgi:PKHD-type hydroxylase